MKRVYVAGPYSADNAIEVLKNIGKGEKVCADLFRYGYAPFCPWHDKSYVIDRPFDDFTVQQFYDFSMAWLRVSDAVFLVRGWEKSNGTLAEVEEARKMNIPVFDNYLDLARWNEGTEKS